MPLYFSTGAFASESPEEIAAECRGSLGVGLEFTSSFAYAADLPDRVRQLVVSDLLIHNYFPPPPQPFVLNLAATDPAVRANSLALCRTAIELTAQLGAPFYSVHSGFAMNLAPSQLGQPAQQAALAAEHQIDRKTAEQIFRASVVELAAYAAQRGVGLLLENNVITKSQVAAGRADSLLLTTPAECQRFFANLGDPNVGLLLDVAHAKVAGRALDFSAADFFDLSPHLRALHLSDNDGLADTNQPIGADSWFAPHLATHRHLPMVVEVYRLSAETRAQQRDLIRTLLA